MNCLFLYHPTSGKGKVAKKIGYIRKTLLAHFESVDIVATESGEDMTLHARSGAEKYDVILFSGGDGTFNRVLQGIGEKDVRLGYIPGGTTNDVARSLGIPRSVRGALKVILKGHEARLDVMRLNGGRYAMYIAAAGAFTRATYTTKPSTKKKFGILAYAFEVIRKELRLRVFPLKVTCGEQTLKTHSVLILTMNGRSVAGMFVNKHGSMADGQMELAVIRQKERPGFFARMGAYVSLVALFLFRGKVRRRHIATMRGDRFLIETAEDVVWDLDGEEGMRGDIEIELLPGRMRLFVPEKKKI
ncbi:MAG TPA: diacylglycerol kinase family lipid kinase [Firmicutes bacterium]|mgnify:CR=1 FL=1|nr:diacylglycerol kinase family lipid kinase [Bacillota bacterium]